MKQAKERDVVVPFAVDDLRLIRVPEPLAVLFLCNPPRLQPWLRSPLATNDETRRSRRMSVAAAQNITKLIDDKYENFKEANNNGITCYLMDGTSNRYYNVGSRRIYDLKYSTII